MGSALRAAAIAAVVLVAGAPAQPVLAHHCFDAVFDATAPIVLTGKVVTVQWVNPHAKIYVTGAQAGKAPQTFAFWTGTPNTLLRLGVTRDVLAPGTEVTLRGWLAKDRACPENTITHTSTCTADARTLTLADGRQFFVGATGQNAPSAAPEAGAAPLETPVARADPPGGASWCP